MLFLTYSTLNWKTYDKSDIDIGKLNLDNELEEEIPIIEQVIPPPPPLLLQRLQKSLKSLKTKKKLKKLSLNQRKLIKMKR
jgi:hypothetical protein